jgi:ribosomal protein RSM22 (predicted rRNA methylase)
MITARLPADLRAALEELGAAHAPGELARAAAALSEMYRAGRARPLERPVEAAAYALTRMPATYGALRAAWREVREPVSTLLDLGAGTGAAGWAAAEHWPACEVTLVEANAAMRSAGEAMGAPSARWRGGDFRNLAGLGGHGLVSFSYSLGELGEREALETVEPAWALADRTLTVVEPGTPKGSEFVLKVRQRLIELGAWVAAPCPHEGVCPLNGPDWCHFAVRVERTRMHRLLKGGELGYEDEKFSYVVAVREPAGKGGARILRHPWQEKGVVRLELCSEAGLRTRTVTRREKSTFRTARKASWGEEWQERDDDSGTD